MWKSESELYDFTFDIVLSLGMSQLQCGQPEIAPHAWQLAPVWPWVSLRMCETCLSLLAGLRAHMCIHAPSPGDHTL